MATADVTPLLQNGKEDSDDEDMYSAKVDGQNQPDDMKTQQGQQANMPANARADRQEDIPVLQVPPQPQEQHQHDDLLLEDHQANQQVDLADDINLIDDTDQENEEEEEEEGDETFVTTTKGEEKRFWQRGCFANCSRLDYFQAALYVILLLQNLGVAVIMVFTKIASHNHCLPRASLGEGSDMQDHFMTVWGCEMPMYYGMVGMVVFYTFILGRWVAQLNNNLKWQRVELVIISISLGGSIISNASLITGWLFWCNEVSDKGSCLNKGTACPGGWKNVSSCWDAVKFIDDKYSLKLETVYNYMMASLPLNIVSMFLWTLAVVLMTYKFCSSFYQNRANPEPNPHDRYQERLQGGRERTVEEREEDDQNPGDENDAPQARADEGAEGGHVQPLVMVHNHGNIQATDVDPEEDGVDNDDQPPLINVQA